MGLDNGVILKSRESVKDRVIALWNHYFPEYSKECDIEERFCQTDWVYSLGEGRWIEVAYPHYELDVAYWRKCWNVRDIAFETIPGLKDGETTELSIEDVRNFIIGLSEINTPQAWDDCGNSWCGGSIWESEVMFPDGTSAHSKIAHAMRAMAIAAHIVEEDEDDGEYGTYCEFYDSY